MWKGFSLMKTRRVGLIVWLRNLREARNLERHGHVIYVSRRMKYAVMYVNQSELKAKMNQLGKLPFVRKVEPSYMHEVSVEYQHKSPLEEQIR